MYSKKETLVLLFLGISIGARHRALSNLKVKDVDFSDRVIQVYESKTRDYVLKFPPHSVFELLETYVNDVGLL